MKVTKEQLIKESGIPKSEKMKIVKAMRNNSFLNYRDDLEKHGMKVEFSTSPFAHYRITHRKWGKRKDGKESSIFITSKRNVGDDAEYVSNDNVAMGELTEAISEKMKTREQLKEIVKGVLQEKISEGKDLKVGDEVLFNGNYKGLVKQIHTSGKLKGMIDVIKKGRSSVTTVDAGSVKKVNESVEEAKKADLSKFTTKTLRDLYAVLDGKAITPKEKASVKQLRAELVKRKVIKKEVTAVESVEMGLLQRCIAELVAKGHSPNESASACKSWGLREDREDIMKITKERLKEIVREELTELNEVKSTDSLSGKDIVAKMKQSKFKWQDFIGKKGIEAISKKGKWTSKELDQLLPDYVPGQEISGLFEGE
jgi:hypothetical protein